MMHYIVTVDMTLLLSRLVKFRLSNFSRQITKIDIDASDPDDACYSVFKAFCDIILEQDDSTETKFLLKDLKYDFKVTKLNVKKL